MNLVQAVEQVIDQEPWALKEVSSLVANMGCHAIFSLDRLDHIERSAIDIILSFDTGI